MWWTGNAATMLNQEAIVSLGMMCGGNKLRGGGSRHKYINVKTYYYTGENIN
jgi:hypothetical protein